EGHAAAAPGAGRRGGAPVRAAALRSGLAPTDGPSAAGPGDGEAWIGSRSALVAPGAQQVVDDEAPLAAGRERDLGHFDAVELDGAAPVAHGAGEQGVFLLRTQSLLARHHTQRDLARLALV